MNEHYVAVFNTDVGYACVLANGTTSVRGVKGFPEISRSFASAVHSYMKYSLVPVTPEPITVVPTNERHLNARLLSKSEMKTLLDLL